MEVDFLSPQLVNDLNCCLRLEVKILWTMLICALTTQVKKSNVILKHKCLMVRLELSSDPHDVVFY